MSDTTECPFVLPRCEACLGRDVSVVHALVDCRGTGSLRFELFAQTGLRPCIAGRALLVELFQDRPSTVELALRVSFVGQACALCLGAAGAADEDLDDTLLSAVARGLPPLQDLVADVASDELCFLLPMP